MNLFGLVLLVLIPINNASPVRSQLYNLDDNVQILNKHNFKSLVKNSTKAWLVEFYASWCGSCIRFAPTWKHLSREIIGWQDLVRLAVVDCSEEINLHICNDYKINKYPTVKYFHESYESGLGEIVDRKDHSVEGVKAGIIERIILEMHEGRGTQYPDLTPYSETNYSKFFEKVPKDIEFGFLIVGEPGQYSGAELALDLHKTHKIAIKQAYSNNSDLAKALEIKVLPALVVLDRNNNKAIYESVNTREQIKEEIKKYLTKKGVKLMEDMKIYVENTDESMVEDNQGERVWLREYIKKMGDVIFQIDLEAALRYSLQQEVATVKSIKGAQLQALRNYLTIIKKYFPLGYNNTYFIEELVNTTGSSEEISGAQIHAIVKKAEFSSPQRFLACEGSSGKYRGYPCSLWKLFHYLTVNCALKNLNSRNANPLEILDGMHGYIKYFFGCRECSDHFHEMAVERNILGVSSLDESILWLWKAHNVVNERLKGDATEDPEYPKYQFPSKILCPECYKEDNEFNTEEVRKYLKRMYSVYNVRYIGSDTKLLFAGLDK